MYFPNATILSEWILFRRVIARASCPRRIRAFLRRYVFRTIAKKKKKMEKICNRRLMEFIPSTEIAVGEAEAILRYLLSFLDSFFFIYRR